MILSFEVLSGCEGVVQQITRNIRDYVYERDILLSVEKSDGSISEVFATFGGTLTDLYVKEGQRISPNTVVASMTENLADVTLGSD